MKTFTLAGTLILAALTFTGPAYPAEMCRHAQMPGGGYVCVADCAPRAYSEKINELLDADFRFLILDIRNQAGREPIRFNPSSDRLILGMADGTQAESIDVSERALAATAGLEPREGVDLRMRFGEIHVGPGTRTFAVVAFRPQSNFAEILDIYLEQGPIGSGAEPVRRKLEPQTDDTDPPMEFLTRTRSEAG